MKRFYKMWFITLIMAAGFISGCDSSDSSVATPDRSLPSVTSTMPADLGTNAALNMSVAAIFSTGMDVATITTAVFTLKNGSTNVPGAVSYSGYIAVFNPTGNLTAGTIYTATITTAAKALDGRALAVSKTWSFTTGTTSDTTPPAVILTFPGDTETGVVLNRNVSAVFSEWMDPQTITSTTFTLVKTSGSVPVTGSLQCTGKTATFNPTTDLESTTGYTATITTGAADLAGNQLAAVKTWIFTTGSAATSNPSAVDLGNSGYSAGNFAILSKTGIDTTGTTSIVGDLGVSPAAATYITGFGLIADSTNLFSTSSLVTGEIYAADYAVPTPANMTAAISNMEWAYNNAAGRSTPDFTELGAGDISGLTLCRGLYNWSTALLITTDIYLDGSATDVWIFQIFGNVTISSGVRIHLIGGALAKNIFWQTSDSVVMNTTSHLEGIVLSQKKITMATGATVNGRLLSQTAVTLDANTVTEPSN